MGNDVLIKEDPVKKAKRQARNKRKANLRKALAKSTSVRQRRVAKQAFKKG